jgi:hypothetical protein
MICYRYRRKRRRFGRRPAISPCAASIYSRSPCFAPSRAREAHLDAGGLPKLDRSHPRFKPDRVMNSTLYSRLMPVPVMARS